MIVYHVTREVLNGIKLIPRVPTNIIKNEDLIIKRICFSASLNGCLISIDNLVFDDKLYVYQADIKPYYPTLKQVPDMFLTGEVWSLEIVNNLKLMGVISITGYIGCEIDGEVNNQYAYKFNTKEAI